MEGVSLLLIAVVALALLFDFTNGFHDAANAIATAVSTRAMRPRVAVAMASILNFVGAFVSLEVAATVAKGIVEVGDVTLTIVIAGLIGTISWNLITWYLGLPTSSSHALIGGMVGAVAVASAFNGIKWDSLVDKVIIPSGVAPFIGLVFGGAIAIAAAWAAKGLSPSVANRLFRFMQIGSSSFMSFTHGQNDAQKTMGLIALALIVSGHLDAENLKIPVWVIVSAASSISLGTYIGGWRIIRTVGSKIVKLEPHQGFAAQTGAGLVLFFTGHVGFPVSTTHTISGAVLGAGATRRLSAVRWGIAGQILIAWVITIPATAIMAAAAYSLTLLPGGAFILAGLIVVILTFIFTRLRAQREQALPGSKD